MAGVAAPERVAPEHAPARLGYIPALDGLRALAVVAVLLYHADQKWIPGGFLGVDVFFVLSGFLVTLLLLGEYERSDGVELRGFWTRRIRRLVPAQVAMVVVVVAVTAIFYREDLLALRGQVIAALTATMNWYLLSTNGSYFAAFGRPPVLRHLWSLAIEMQFYVFWPVCFLALMRRWKDDLARVALVILAIAAGASDKSTGPRVTETASLLNVGGPFGGVP